jgi:hypothetical protein
MELTHGIFLALQYLFSGNFLAKLMVGITMKKFMEATRVLQIISFFILIKINYTPPSSLFLTKIYELCIFKILSDEAIQWFLIWCGAKIESERSLVIIGERLEVGEKQSKIAELLESLLTNLNILAIGVFIFLVFSVLVIVSLCIYQRSPKTK